MNGFAPDEGRRSCRWPVPDPPLAVPDPTTVFDFVPYPGAPPGDVDLYLKRNVFLTSFASGVPAWKTILSWYLIGTQEQIITPTQQRFMAHRAHARTVEVRARHLSLVTRPGDVTARIVTAARATT